MSASLPKPKRTDSAPSPAEVQDMGVLLDAHGAPLLHQFYYPAEQLLYVQWFGNLTAESVVAGAKVVLQTQEKLRFPLLLNNKHGSTGDWSEAMEWLEFEWLPQAYASGLRAFAYVFAPDLNNQLASLEFVARSSQRLAIQVFFDPILAQVWLQQQLPENQ
ncbi:hypothetical protein MTX78_06055 [Hymenobacter tibetensis]|uniref:STAS/SEC14 domain-containing protein n=1 Tax=Hymenobacter tibetensis TaxID=497967 RepID=A0ABY4D1R3_9BACT|nr:hypothetical protein [Hymenobacter tibetensis]UOG76157.1 hypothetical protein MTX78_06055 [Hymenobacter tibetensis]